MAKFAESEVEDAAFAWLAALDWTAAHGPDVAPDAPGAERAGYGAGMLEGRLRDALARFNPALPAPALDDAFRKPVRPGLRFRPPMPFGIGSDLSWHRLPRGPQNPAFSPVFGTDCYRSLYSGKFAFAMPGG